MPVNGTAIMQGNKQRRTANAKVAFYAIWNTFWLPHRELSLKLILQRHSGVFMAVNLRTITWLESASQPFTGWQWCCGASLRP
jgi:hypothetical protein